MHSIPTLGGQMLIVVHVCKHVCMYVHMYVCIHACLYAYMHVCMHTCIMYALELLKTVTYLVGREPLT